jgi:hypothetical protein
MKLSRIYMQVERLDSIMKSKWITFFDTNNKLLQQLKNYLSTLKKVDNMDVASWSVGVAHKMEDNELFDPDLSYQDSLPIIAILLDADLDRYKALKEMYYQKGTPYTTETIPMMMLDEMLVANFSIIIQETAVLAQFLKHLKQDSLLTQGNVEKILAHKAILLTPAVMDTLVQSKPEHWSQDILDAFFEACGKEEPQKQLHTVMSDKLKRPEILYRFNRWEASLKESQDHLKLNK